MGNLTICQKIYRTIKAVFDFIIALVSIILLLPLFLIVAIAIKIDSKGPVFFIQKRIGKGGKLFNCIKFRSMSVEARHYVAGHKYKNVQSYITKVGAFMRKFSIDELPQLFNILTFKMSFIGYRPAQDNETELNNARLGYNMYQLRPGLTGWAQINGRDVLASNPKKKAEYDAYYLQRFSILLDVKIFLITIVKVLKSEGVVEGIIDSSQSKTDGNNLIVNDREKNSYSALKEALENFANEEKEEVI